MFETYSLTYKNVELECLNSITTSYSSMGDIFHQPLSNNKRYHMPTITGLRDFKLEIIIKGLNFQDYIKRRDEVMDLFKDGVGGTLVHPFYGNVYVACLRNSISIEESFERLGLSTISVTLYEITKSSTIKEEVQLTLLSPSALKEILLKDVKTQLNSLITLDTQAQAILQKINKIIPSINKPRNIYNNIRRGITRLSNYINQIFDKFESVLAIPTIFRTSIATFTSLKTRYNNIVQRFSSMTRSDSGNPVITATLIDEVVEFLEYLKDSPQEEAEETKNPLNNLLNTESSVSKITLDLLGESQTIYQSILAQDNEIRLTEQVAFGNSSSVSTRDNPNDLNDQLIFRSIRILEELVHLYNFINLLQELRDYEFTTTNEALNYLSLIKSNLSTTESYKEINISIAVNARKLAYQVSQMITSQLNNLQQLVEVETNNLPLRVVLYKYTGSTNSLFSSYESNPIFDVGITPDKLTIIKPR